MNKPQHRKAWLLFLGGLLCSGCAGPHIAPAPLTSGRPPQDAFDGALAALKRMHFQIAKADAPAGVIQTQPLRGAQWFEFWRHDNADPGSFTQANIHSLRRTATVTIKESASGLQILCRVQTQRLSVPSQPVTSSSQVYRILSDSEPLVQHLSVTDAQAAAMDWVELGPDPALEARILQAIERQLHKV